MFPRDTENHCFNLLIRSELKCEKWFEGQNSSGCSGSAIQIIVTVKIRKKVLFLYQVFKSKTLKMTIDQLFILNYTEKSL